MIWKIICTILMFPLWVMSIMMEFTMHRYSPQHISISTPWELDRSTNPIGRVVSIGLWVMIFTLFYYKV